MAVENDTPETVEGVVIPNGDGEGATLAVDLPSSEAGDETGGESDAVAIARIEAEKEITVTAIRADAETAQAEAHAEAASEIAQAESERINEPWQNEIAALRESIAELTSRMLELTSQSSALVSIPANSTEPEATETLAEEAAELATETAVEAENNSTQEFMSPPTSETRTEATLSDEDGNEETATVRVKKRRRLI